MSTKAEPMSVPAAEKPTAANPKVAKEKKPKAPKEKKAAPQHPSYFQMIKEAITTIKDKGGLSAYAIAKYMEAKYKSVLPANYKKTLTVQLRNCVSRGKLVKVKGSFKLSEASKKVAPKKVTVKKAGAKKVAEKKAGAKKAAGKEVKETKKRKKPASGGAAAAKKPKKPMAKKVKKATPVKKPKSIKSPAAKRARKMAA